MPASDLEVWKDYVTLINAARLNAMRDTMITNENNISAQQVSINANTSGISQLEETKIDQDGSVIMEADLDMGDHRIINLSNPTIGNEAANKSYVDEIQDNLSSNVYSNDQDINNLSSSVKTNTDDINNLSSLQDDYLLLDGSRALTGAELKFSGQGVIYANSENGYLRLQGGTSYSPRINLYGKDNSLGGKIRFYTPNAAGSDVIKACEINGLSDTPQFITYYGLNISNAILLKYDSGNDQLWIKNPAETAWKTIKAEKFISYDAEYMDGKVYFGSATSIESDADISIVPYNITTAVFDLSGGLKIDKISELTNNSGVTIDSCLIKDGIVANSSKLSGLTKNDILNLSSRVTTNEDDIDNLSSNFGNYVKRDGSTSMTGDLNINYHDITNVSRLFLRWEPTVAPILLKNYLNCLYIRNYDDSDWKDLYCSSVYAHEPIVISCTDNCYLHFYDPDDSSRRWKIQRSASLLQFVKTPASGDEIAAEFDGSLNLDMKEHYIYNVNWITAAGSIKQIGAYGAEFEAGYIKTLLAPTKVQTDTIEEYTSDNGVTIEGCLIKDGHLPHLHRTLPFYVKNLSSTEYLLGTGTADTMYPFNETIIITNYAITFHTDTNSRIDIELADVDGAWHTNSITKSAAGGYIENVSFTAHTVAVSDKLQIKLYNVSNIDYLTFVLSYL